MRLYVSVDLKRGNQNNYERIVSQALKGVRRRLDYSTLNEKQELILAFSAHEMPLRNVVKQFKSEEKEFRTEEFLNSRLIYDSYPAWRVACEIKVGENKWLVFFEKSLDN